MSYLSDCASSIRSSQEHYLALIEQLSQINTHSYNIAGLDTCRKLLQNSFPYPHQTIHSLEPITIVNDAGVISKQQLGSSLVIQSKPNLSSWILLGGHYDTVFSPESPFQTTTRTDTTLKGPGVADMKGGLVVLLAGLAAYEKNYQKKKIDWKIIISPDEEIGSPGSSPLYKQLSSHALAALIFEPAFGDGSYVSERGGSCTLSINVRGKAAHAGRDFHSGKSALLAFSPILSALENLAQICSDQTGSQVIINVGKLHAGTAHNIVPDTCVARINIRSTSLTGILLAKRSIETLVADFGKKEGISMSIIGSSFHPPKPLNEQNKKIFTLLSECAQEMKLPLSTCMSYGVTDGNDLSAYGIPTIDSMGVIGGGLHTEEEYMIIDSFQERALMTALLLAKLSEAKLSESQLSDEQSL